MWFSPCFCIPSGLACVTRGIWYDSVWIPRPGHKWYYSFCISLLDCSFWGKSASMTWGYSSSPVEKLSWGRIEACCQLLAPIWQPCEWATLKVNPPGQVKPSGANSPGWALPIISWEIVLSQCCRPVVDPSRYCSIKWLLIPSIYLAPCKSVAVNIKIKKLRA